MALNWVVRWKSNRRHILQKDLDRMENWDSKNCMKFNKQKSQVLYLETTQPKCPVQARISVAGSNLAGRDLGLLVTTSWSVVSRMLQQQQRQIGSWAASAGALLAERDAVTPPYTAPVRPHLEYWSSSGPHSSRKRKKEYFTERLERIQRN